MIALAPDAIRRRFDEAPMSRLQVRTVGLTVLLSALDGYDVLSVTFAAPAISAAWAISKTQLGVVLSSGLAGMALGSFLIAPLADWLGRRRLIFVSLALMALGSLLCAFARSLPELAAWRVITGLGIGACVAVINPIAAEFANARRRPLAMAAMAMGYPAGGLVGGLLAALLLRLFGWPAVFVAGFVAAVSLGAVVAAMLPESLGFLLARRHPDQLGRLNHLLTRCGQPVLASAPASAARAGGYAGVFASSQRAATARLALVNMLTAAVIYYLLSWLPQMVGDAGFAPATGSLVAATLNLVGIGSGLSLGLLAARVGLQRLTVAAVVGLGCAVVAFGAAPPSLPLLFAAAAMCGLCVFGASAGFYAVLASSFPDSARASGSGFVIGVGRISSAVAPLLAGWLFATGMSRGTVSLAFGACALTAGALLATYRPAEGPLP